MTTAMKHSFSMEHHHRSYQVEKENRVPQHKPQNPTRTLTSRSKTSPLPNVDIHTPLGSLECGNLNISLGQATTERRYIPPPLPSSSYSFFDGRKHVGLRTTFKDGLGLSLGSDTPSTSIHALGVTPTGSIKELAYNLQDITLHPSITRTTRVRLQFGHDSCLWIPADRTPHRPSPSASSDSMDASYTPSSPHSRSSTSPSTITQHFDQTLDRRERVPLSRVLSCSEDNIDLPPLAYDAPCPSKPRMPCRALMPDTRELYLDECDAGDEDGGDVGDEEAKREVLGQIAGGEA